MKIITRTTQFLVTLAALAAPHAWAQSAASTTSPAPASAASTTQPSNSTTASSVQRWNWHAQNTDIVQGDAGFSAKYSGTNSLSTKSQIQHTVTVDLFGGARLDSSTEAHADFLIWQGYGLSQTLGVEAFPNSDAYKLGTVNPNYSFARLFIRKYVGLGGAQEDVADDQLDLAGKRDIKRLTITAGRFSVLDVFDYNSYANDPHTQFMNWAFVGDLAFDYAADAIGYATGATVELNQPTWTLRYGIFQLPKVPNSFTAEDRFLMWPGRGADAPLLNSWSMVSELEKRYNVGAHPGTVRLQAWGDRADMYNYDTAAAYLTANGANTNLSPLQYYQDKYGFGLNWEQELANNVGAFSRLGWNDGQQQAWAYTDANWSASLGTSLKGGIWGRQNDTIGLATVVSGASSANQKFLEAGGLGILDGDGALNYGWEQTTETYYNLKTSKTTQCALDYQYVNNPAFNRDRGPVSVFGFRFHWEM